LQIRGPRFDSGRRLQLIVASTTFTRRKSPENNTKPHRKVTVTRVDVMGCTWTQDFSFSSATIHAAFATPTRGWPHEHKYHERFDITVLRIFGTHNAIRIPRARACRPTACHNKWPGRTSTAALPRSCWTRRLQSCIEI